MAPNVVTITAQRKETEITIIPWWNQQEKNGRRLHCYHSPTTSQSIPSCISCKMYLPIDRTWLGSTEGSQWIWSCEPNPGTLGLRERVKKEKKVTTDYLFVPHFTHLKPGGSISFSLRFYCISPGSNYFSSLKFLLRIQNNYQSWFYQVKFLPPPYKNVGTLPKYSQSDIGKGKKNLPQYM